MGAGQSVTNKKGKSQLHIDEKELQGDRGANSRLEEAIKKEKANFSSASKKIQSQEKELEKKRFEKMVGKQAAAGPLSILTKFLRLSLKSEKKRSQIVPCQSPRKGEV
ncbi:Arginine--tRNA ligase [Dissostichus eleginoides]|uniref:Arginine--tRNA ligase n=1 Tax=Dissostichus eleginoides TaxID=100907 RepID=A0AAD9C773_DISEL|nr:Arginine--tRNA ligase [Dissostichus eleginoides]